MSFDTQGFGETAAPDGAFPRAEQVRESGGLSPPSHRQRVAAEAVPESSATPDGSQSLECEARAFAYQLIGRLLIAPPTAELMRDLSGLAPVDAATSDGFAPHWRALAAVAAQPGMSVDQVEAEYTDLFIGLGRGQVVPYGSWYATGFLMDRPLAELRADLASLGFERDPAKREPEDHMGGLCEVMAMLIETQAAGGDSGAAAIASQQRLFSRHIEPWGKVFFRDLGGAPAAAFYRPVAQLGEALVDFETDYLRLLK